MIADSTAALPEKVLLRASATDLAVLSSSDDSVALSCTTYMYVAGLTASAPCLGLTCSAALCPSWRDTGCVLLFVWLPSDLESWKVLHGDEFHVRLLQPRLSEAAMAVVRHPLQLPLRLAKRWPC